MIVSVDIDKYYEKEEKEYETDWNWPKPIQGKFYLFFDGLNYIFSIFSCTFCTLHQLKENQFVLLRD